MNPINPIGGFLELELADNDIPYSDSILLNTGRNCFEYVLLATNCTHVYMPLYTCAVMLEPLTRHNISYSFYGIDKNLEIKDEIELKENELIVYTNYYGIKDDYSLRLSEKYGDRLILDNSQAFYSPVAPKGHTFYSPRKFFALPDGGCLVTNVRLEGELPLDVSYDRMLNLLRRIDLGAEEDFELYRGTAAALKNQPIKSMSKLTRRLMGNIDYEDVRQRRLANFMHLHEHLKDTNEITIDTEHFESALFYPYLIKDGDEKLRDRLYENKVLFARYWRNVLEWSKEGDLEHYIAKDMLPLPVNQNYTPEDMQRVVDVIKSA